MKTFLSYVVVAAGLVGCNSDKISKSDIQALIDNKQKSTAEILARTEELLRKRGLYNSDGEVMDSFFTLHKEVLSFLDSLDNLEKEYIPEAATTFVKNSFYPHELSLFAENTPVSLIKLQIVDLENAYMQVEAVGFGLSASNLRFDRASLVIIPDNIGFTETDKLTGTVAFMGWPAQMKQTIFVNDKEVEITDGRGNFAIDPKELKGLDSLRARIVLPGQTHSTSIPIKRCK